MMWRYTILYVTERCYESGGRVWDQVFQNVCWCLFICIFFTGAPPTLLCWCTFACANSYIHSQNCLLH